MDFYRFASGAAQATRKHGTRARPHTSNGQSGGEELILKILKALFGMSQPCSKIRIQLNYSSGRGFMSGGGNTCTQLDAILSSWVESGARELGICFFFLQRKKKLLRLYDFLFEDC